MYVNRVYLADRRAASFTQQEIDIASHPGVGLIQIKDRRCIEVLASPYHHPMGRLGLELVARMALGRCQLCGTFFDIGDSKTKRFTKVSKLYARAADSEKGLMFFNFELAGRKNKLGIRPEKKRWSHQRRYLCPDCIGNVFAQASKTSVLTQY